MAKAKHWGPGSEHAGAWEDCFDCDCHVVPLLPDPETPQVAEETCGRCGGTADRIFADEQACQAALAADPTNAWLAGRLLGLQRARDIATREDM